MVSACFCDKNVDFPERNLLEPAVHGWWALAGFCAHQGAYKITLELEMLDELNP